MEKTVADNKKLEKQKAQGKVEKTVMQRESSVQEQRSEEAKKQKSGEAEKQRTIQAEKQGRAEKQANREIEIINKNAQNEKR